MNNPQQNSTPPNDVPESTKWTDCPKGQIAMLSQDGRSRERQLIVRRVATMTSTFCVLLFVGYLIVGQPFAKELRGSISCKEVMDNADAFLANTIQGNIFQEIKHHLIDCESCRNKFKEQKNKKQSDQSGAFLKKRTELISSIE